MNSAEYQKLAARTMASDAMKAPPLAVWALGLAGEAEEFCGSGTVQLVEEAGDVMWYAAAICTDIGVPLARSFDEVPWKGNGEIRRNVGAVVEHVKKHLGHGHDLDKAKIVYHLGRILDGLACFVDIGHAMRANIAKLRERYPDGFSTERSINRDGPPVTSQTNPMPPVAKRLDVIESNINVRWPITIDDDAVAIVNAAHLARERGTASTADLVVMTKATHDRTCVGICRTDKDVARIMASVESVRSGKTSAAVHEGFAIVEAKHFEGLTSRDACGTVSKGEAVYVANECFINAHDEMKRELAKAIAARNEMAGELRHALAATRETIERAKKAEAREDELIRERDEAAKSFSTILRTSASEVKRLNETFRAKYVEASEELAKDRE